MTLAYPSPPPPVPKQSHRLRWVLVALAVLLAMLITATVGYLVTRPTPKLSLSQSTVQAGDTLTVTASNLPANQRGVIQLLSVLHEVSFQADSSGNVTTYLTIPSDTPPGSHTIRVCWNSVCHASTTLQVLSPALPSPSPSPTPSANPSPTPLASPSPTSATRTLALSSGRIPLHGKMSVYGLHFSPDRTITVTFVQGSTTNAIVSKPVSNPDGTFLVNFTIPSTVVVGPAYIRACDSVACAYASFTVIA